MTPRAPSSLPLKGIESDLVRSLDFNDVVNAFAQRQCGKTHMVQGQTALLPGATVMFTALMSSATVRLDQ